MIKEKESSRGINGFTLVELLAVIVILAIILVIAVPKVMSIIEDAKKGTLESTAKMIASAAEKAKVQNTVLGKTEEITCDSVAKINKGDYANCSIEFVDNDAKVTIEGKGKFDGLYVCAGTKTEATASKQSCTGNCLISDVEITEKINVDNCVTHLKSVFEEYYSEEYAAQGMREHCERKEYYYDEDSEEDYYSIDTNIRWFMEDGYITKEELIEKGVFEEEINKICVTEETPASCFTYEQPKTYKVNDVESCISYTKDAFSEELSLTEEEVTVLCEGEEIDYGEGIYYLPDDLFYLIDMGYFTEEELIENNVLKVEYDDELTITGYDKTCGIDNVVVPNTIDGIKVTKIMYAAFNKIEEVCEEDECWDDTYTFPIKRIRFRENVRFIPNNLFENGSLKYVYVDNQDAEIRNCAFGDINNIEKHNLPNTYQCIIDDDSDEEDEDYCEECDGCCDEECPDGTQEVCEEVCDDETGECWDDCWDECI